MLPILIQEVADEFRLFPGVGRKNAQKLALDILNLDPEKFDQLSKLMQAMRQQVHFCQNCGFFAQQQICEICTGKNRQDSLICLVENPVDILTLEKAETYKGKYFVLEKLISPLDNVFPENTKIFDLFNRRIQEVLKTSEKVELIVFLKNSFASESTIAYLKEYIVSQNLSSKVVLTRMAQGLPLYFNPESVDSATVSKALIGRTSVV
jgi:recombination protein RecR